MLMVYVKLSELPENLTIAHLCFYTLTVLVNVSMTYMHVIPKRIGVLYMYL